MRRSVLITSVSASAFGVKSTFQASKSFRLYLQKKKNVSGDESLSCNFTYLYALIHSYAYSEQVSLTVVMNLNRFLNFSDFRCLIQGKFQHR